MRNLLRELVVNDQKRSSEIWADKDRFRGKMSCLRLCCSENSEIGGMPHRFRGDGLPYLRLWIGGV